MSTDNDGFWGDVDDDNRTLQDEISIRPHNGPRISQSECLAMRALDSCEHWSPSTIAFALERQTRVVARHINGKCGHSQGDADDAIKALNAAREALICREYHQLENAALALLAEARRRKAGDLR